MNSHLLLLTVFAALPAAACSRLAGSGHKLSGLGAPLMGLFMAAPFAQDAVTLGLATGGLWIARKLPLGNAIGPFMSRTEPANEKTATNPGPEWWQFVGMSAESSVVLLGALRGAVVILPLLVVALLGYPVVTTPLLAIGVMVATPLACYIGRREVDDRAPADFGWGLQEYFWPPLAMVLAAVLVTVFK